MIDRSHSIDRAEISDEHAHLKAVVDGLAIPVTRCTRDLRYQWVNRHYAAWLGRPASAIVGRRIADVIGPDAMAAIRPYITRVLSGERVEYEERIRFDGPGMRWVRATYSPTVDADGGIDGWVALVVDIDAKHSSDDAAREARAVADRLAAIVHSSEDAIISKDLDGLVTSWNPAAERMYGYRADEVIGRSIRLIIPADRGGEDEAVIARIRRGEHVPLFETIRIHKDGTSVPIALTVSPVYDSTGRVVGASKIARNISDRKRAEAQAERARRRAEVVAHLSAVLTSSRDLDLALRTLADFAVPRIADYCAVDVLADNGQLAPLAAAHVDAAQLDGMQRVRERHADPADGLSAAHVVRTRLAAIVPWVTDGLLEQAAGGDEARLRVMRALGIVSYLCVPMIAHDHVFGALTLATTASSGRVYGDEDIQLAEDVASRAAMAIENAQAYQQLTAANRVKDEFLATLSHELRTPLNAVLGYARILRGGLLQGDTAVHALQVMERNATALTHIVDDVLDMSHIVSGRTRLQVQPVDLRTVVRAATETVRPAAEAKGVRLQAFIESHAEPISGDPERLQQVVWNLLANAVKFTPRDGRVQVRVASVDAHVEVVVTDTGMGIAADFLPHVFERFRQADSSTTRRHGGLGLGLAIARHIVEMHGGTIDVESPGEGAGATFRVRLPPLAARLARPLDEVRAPSRAGRTVPIAELPSLSGIRVLAVDDDEDALGLLRAILEVTGADITTVSTASDAMRVLHAEHPDVLIADLGMPTADGFDLIDEVRQSADRAVRAVPAAALTAFARSEDRARVLQRGFEMHLAKPIDPAALVDAVGALARRQLKRR